MIEKGIDGAPHKKHTCYTLDKQITLPTINRLKQKLGYRNRHIVYYKTRIPDSPAEATLTEIDFDVDVERMKKIHEEMVIRLVVTREPIPINHTMAITPLKSKSVYAQADDDEEEVEECDLDEYKLWLA
jgi:hypothetical protein